jgi:serine/threonine protein kinase
LCAFRNLNPQSIRFDRSQDGSAITVIDFAESRYLLDDCTVRGFCGVVGFAAPECLLLQPHGFSVDMWAVGILAVLMLTGTLPFGNKLSTYLRAASSSPASMQNFKAFGMSAPATNFVGRLLTSTPADRMNAETGSSHPWVRTELCDF